MTSHHLFLAFMILSAAAASSSTATQRLRNGATMGDVEPADSVSEAECLDKAVAKFGSKLPGGCSVQSGADWAAYFNHAGGRDNEDYTPVYEVPTVTNFDLGGKPFRVTATVTTTATTGIIFAKAFPNGAWRHGGDYGQGKMLFLRDGRLVFDIG